jgi:hypothetical protein
MLPSMIALAVRAVRQRDQAGPAEPTGIPPSGGSGNDPARFLPVLMLLFLASGMSALIYDLITSDPIHPFVKGSASLYSREYFEMVREHLNPHGIVTQWVPLYESEDLRLQYLAGMALNQQTGNDIYRRILSYRVWPSKEFTGSDANMALLTQALVD